MSKNSILLALFIAPMAAMACYVNLSNGRDCPYSIEVGGDDPGPCNLVNGSIPDVAAAGPGQEGHTLIFEYGTPGCTYWCPGGNRAFYPGNYVGGTSCVGSGTGTGN